MNSSDTPYPRCLVESYNYEYSKGAYLGSIEEYAHVKYLLFRVNYPKDKEPPSKRVWLERMRKFEEDSESGK